MFLHHSGNGRFPGGLDETEKHDYPSIVWDHPIESRLYLEWSGPYSNATHNSSYACQEPTVFLLIDPARIVQPWSDPVWTYPCILYPWFGRADRRVLRASLMWGIENCQNAVLLQASFEYLISHLPRASSVLSMERKTHAPRLHLNPYFGYSHNLFPFLDRGPAE